MTTIKDIAAASGLSSTTVSRVLNYDPKISVSDETREKIYYCAKQLGYKKKPSYHRIGTLALLYWVTDREELEDIYFKSIRLEIEKQAKQRNICIVRYKQADGVESVDPNISGFFAIGRFKKEELDHMHSITPNGVFIDSSPDEARFDSVKPNLPLMIRQMIDYYLSQGHQNIGFIGGYDINIDTAAKKMDTREKAFREIAHEYSIFNENNIFIADSLNSSDGYSIAMRAIESRKDSLPTAFCVANDPLAIGTLQAFNEKGWSIPQRVSFFSINNINVSKYVSPPLTTFKIDVPTVCETAFDLIEERISKNRTSTKTILVSGSPVFRKSIQRFMRQSK